MENIREIEETIEESRKVLKKMAKELEAAKKLPDVSERFRAVNRVKSRIIRFKAKAFDAIESAA